MNYLIGLHLYKDLPKGNKEDLINALLGALGGPENTLNYLLNHLHFLEDNSIDYDARKMHQNTNNKAAVLRSVSSRHRKKLRKRK